MNIVIIGVGAVGSLIVKHASGFKNAKDSLRLVLYDHDRVEPHNLSYTIYRKNDVGEPKVCVMQRRYGKKIPINIFFEKYEKQEFPQDSIIISCVDSMAGRSNIWFQAAYKQLERVKFFFDARVDMLTYRAYAINPNIFEEREFYESTLYSDKEARIEPCSQRNKASFEKCAKKIADELRCFLKTGKTNFKGLIFDVKLDRILIRN